MRSFKEFSFKKKNGGFSLLEVMMAIAILAVSLMALFGLQSTSLIGSARAQKISTATLLARQKMSQVFLEIEKGIPKGEFPEEREDSGDFEEEKYPDFVWKLSIKTVEIPAPPAPEGSADLMNSIFSMVSKELSKSTREIKLTVSWREFDEEEEAIVLTTHIVRM